MRTEKQLIADIEDFTKKAEYCTKEAENKTTWAEYYTTWAKEARKELEEMKEQG